MLQRIMHHPHHATTSLILQAHAPSVLTFCSGQTRPSVCVSFTMLAPAQHRIAGRSRAGKETDRAAVLSPWIG
eukprot:superscaffoldBa00004847_g19525